MSSKSSKPSASSHLKNGSFYPADDSNPTIFKSQLTRGDECFDIKNKFTTADAKMVSICVKLGYTAIFNELSAFNLHVADYSDGKAKNRVTVPVRLCQAVFTHEKYSAKSVYCLVYQECVIPEWIAQHPGDFDDESVRRIIALKLNNKA
jgi:hypothetical protein